MAAGWPKNGGVDPKAKSPAYSEYDGVDYVPAEPGVVFGHQFASIAGAGPINGPIQAAVFGCGINQGLPTLINKHRKAHRGHEYQRLLLVERIFPIT